MGSMEQNSIILYALIVLVLVGIPVVLSRKTGKNPMELLFGKRRNRGAFCFNPKEETGRGRGQEKG